MAILSQRLQWILLRKHQYWVGIIYRIIRDLFIADWLSRQNHNENKDTEIPDMQSSINETETATNIPECITMHEQQHATSQDQHLYCLKDYITQGLLESRDQMPWDIRTYWTFRDDMAAIDVVIIKGRHIVVPEALQEQVLQQQHINHMGIEETK